jgi:hypothetical protein
MDLRTHLEFAREFVLRNRGFILELWEQNDLKTERNYSALCAE